MADITLDINTLLNYPANAQAILRRLQADLNRSGARIDFGLDKLNKEFAIAGRSARAVQQVWGRLGSTQQDAARRAVLGLNSINRAQLQAKTLAEELGKQTGITLRRFGGYVIARNLVLGLGGALTQAAKEAISFNRELSKVAQLRSVTTAETGRLRDVIGDLTTTFGIQANELTKSAQTFAQAGRSLTQIETLLKQIAPATLTATFADLGKNVDSLEALLGQFRLEVSQTTSVLDILNSVSKEYNVNVQELFDGLKRSGAAFAALSGVTNATSQEKNLKTFKEFVGVFTSVISLSRESAATIGTSLRTIFPRLQRPSTARVVREELGVSLRDQNNQFIGPFAAVQRISQALSRLQPTDPRFSRVIQEAGGLRQVGRSTALFTQAAAAADVVQIANESQGSVARDAAQAQKELQVQIDRTKQKFQELIRDVVSSGAFDRLADSALKFADALIKVADTVRPLLPLIGVLGAVQLARNAPGFGSFFIRGFDPALLRRAGGGPVDTLLTPGERVFLPKGVQREGKHNLSYYNVTGNSNAIQSFKDSFVVPGVGNTDSVPMKLPSGSFVIRKNSAQRLAFGGQAGGGLFDQTLSSTQTVKFNSILDVLTKQLTKYGTTAARAADIQNRIISQSRTLNELQRKTTFEIREARVNSVLGNFSPQQTVAPGFQSGLLSARRLLNRQPNISEAALLQTINRSLVLNQPEYSQIYNTPFIGPIYRPNLARPVPISNYSNPGFFTPVNRGTFNRRQILGSNLNAAQIRALRRNPRLSSTALARIGQPTTAIETTSNALQTQLAISVARQQLAVQSGAVGNVATQSASTPRNAFGISSPGQILNQNIASRQATQRLQQALNNGQFNSAGTRFNSIFAPVQSQAQLNALQRIGGAGFAASIVGGQLANSQNKAVSVAGTTLASGGFGASAATILGVTNPFAIGLVAAASAATGFATAVDNAKKDIARQSIEQALESYIKKRNNADVRQILQGANVEGSNLSFIPFRNVLPSIREFRRRPNQSNLFNIIDSFGVIPFTFGGARGTDLGAQRNIVRPLVDSIRDRLTNNINRAASFGRDLPPEFTNKLFGSLSIDEIKAVARSSPRFNEALQAGTTGDQLRIEIDLAKEELLKFIDRNRKLANATTRLNNAMIQAAADIEDTAQVAARISRSLSVLSFNQENFQARFDNRLNLVDNPSRRPFVPLFNSFRNLSGASVQELQASIGAVRSFAGNGNLFEGLASRALVAGVLTSNRNAIFGASGQGGTLDKILENQFSLSGPLGKLSPADQDKLTEAFRSAAGVESLGDISPATLGLENFTKIVEQAARTFAPSAEAMADLIDTINAGLSQYNANLDKINQASVQNLQTQIGILGQRFNNQSVVQGIIGNNPFTSVARARAQSSVLLGSFGGGDLNGIIDRVRTTDQNKPLFGQLIAALKFAAEETRTLSAIQKRNSEILQAQQNSRALLGGFASSDPFERLRISGDFENIRRLIRGERVSPENIGRAQSLFDQAFGALGAANNRDRRILSERIFGGLNDPLEIERRFRAGIGRNAAGNVVPGDRDLIRILTEASLPGNREQRGLAGQAAQEFANQERAAIELARIQRALITEQFNALQANQAKFVAGIRDSVDNNNLIEALNQFTKAFGGGETTLKVKVEPIAVQVNIPQANVFEALEPGIRNLVTNTIALELEKRFPV